MATVATVELVPAELAVMELAELAVVQSEAMAALVVIPVRS